MKRGKNGFTLAELLIVVAIIAVLVAISIPIFTSQLKKARLAVDHSAIRDAYAAIQVANNTGEITADGTVYTFEQIKAQKAAGTITGYYVLSSDCSSFLSDYSSDDAYKLKENGSDFYSPCDICALWGIQMSYYHVKDTPIYIHFNSSEGIFEMGPY